MTQALFDTADLFECIALGEAASFQDLCAHRWGAATLYDDVARRWRTPLVIVVA
jgi:hypothetical protein